MMGLQLDLFADRTRVQLRTTPACRCADRRRGLISWLEYCDAVPGPPLQLAAGDSELIDDGHSPTCPNFDRSAA